MSLGMPKCYLSDRLRIDPALITGGRLQVRILNEYIFFIAQSATPRCLGTIDPQGSLSRGAAPWFEQVVYIANTLRVQSAVLRCWLLWQWDLFIGVRESSPSY
jgi:hypothetical protein